MSFFHLGILYYRISTYIIYVDICKDQLTYEKEPPIPILPIVQLFFVIYFPSFVTFYFFKNLLLRQKNINSWIVIGAIIVLSYFIPSILNQLYEILGKTPIFSSLIISILSLTFLIYGLIAFVKSINSISKKYKIIPIVIVIFLLYGILNFIIDSILVKSGIIDKNFNLEKYIINTTSNGFYKLKEKIIQTKILL